MQVLKAIYRHTLGSVPFGIALMVSIALYIAIGSGVPAVREYFEMNEAQFFRAWPLKALMFLFVISMAAITWTRIPFTPPRYGVWCVHLGIITLVISASWHYAMKEEGQVRILVGRSADQYYDAFERSLYVRVGSFGVGQIASLDALPRFNAYAAELGNESRLDRSSLRNISPVIERMDPASQTRIARSLAEDVGVKDLKFDVVGYWPYAEVVSEFVPDTSSNRVALRLTLSDPGTGESLSRWLSADHSDNRRDKFGPTEYEHRHVADPRIVEDVKTAAGQMHRLSLKAGGVERELFVEPGGVYRIDGTGYTLRIERFDPSFPMFGTGEVVRALTIMVTSSAPSQPREFRRMVLSGRDVQTDFDVSVTTAGPMGQRQREPIDRDLVIRYDFADPALLIPLEGTGKHTLITAEGMEGIVDVFVGTTARSQVEHFADGRAKLAMDASGNSVRPDASTRPAFDVTVDRIAGIRRDDRVIEVPREKRDRNLGQIGTMQVLRVRVTSGDWSSDVIVPFVQFAQDDPWRGGVVHVPGANVPLQLQFGYTRRLMPARVTVASFEVVPYAGGDRTARSVMRDFRSHLRITDRTSGALIADGVAQMNQPVYIRSGPTSWLFFQAAWDPQGQRFTVLGIGNRPAVEMMTIGCVMIVLGLLYAFYVKPIIVRRMKEKALRQARNAAASRSPEATVSA